MSDYQPKPNWCRKWNLYCCGCGGKLFHRKDSKHCTLTKDSLNTGNYFCRDQEQLHKKSLLTKRVRDIMVVLQIPMWFRSGLNWTFCGGNLFYFHNNGVYRTLCKLFLFVWIYPDNRLIENKGLCITRSSTMEHLLAAMLMLWIGEFFMKWEM